MSNNNQVIPPLSTEENLEFFIERAEALYGGPFCQDTKSAGSSSLRILVANSPKEVYKRLGLC